MKRSKQWYMLTEDQLFRLVGQGTYSGTEDALEEVRKIKEAGQKPTIYYCEFNGFRIINENDMEQFRIGLSISDNAKRFQM